MVRQRLDCREITLVRAIQQSRLMGRLLPETQFSTNTQSAMKIISGFNQALMNLERITSTIDSNQISTRDDLFCRE